MLEIIDASNADQYIDELASMHHLRYRICVQKLKWPVPSFSMMEHDEFDNADATYLVHRGPLGRINACTRLIPTLKPHLLGDVFSHLMDGKPVIRRADTWETTRFCADASAPRNITGVLVAGMLEFALERNIKHYVAVSDIRIEPVLKRFGWPPQRLGEPQFTGTDYAAAEFWDVTSELLNTVKQRSKLDLSQPVNTYKTQPLRKVA